MAESRCRWCEKASANLDEFGFCDAVCHRLAVWMEWPMTVPAPVQAAREEGDGSMATNGDFPNSGILFNATKDKKDAKDRDYRGDADVICPHCDGRFQLWVSGWLKTAKNGKKFLSLSFKLKQPKNEHAQKPGGAGAPTQAEQEDIPFVIDGDLSPDRRFRI